MLDFVFVQTNECHHEELDTAMTGAEGIQSLLFAPGSRADRIAKALDTAADCVCVDLEDSVPADGKDAARATALAAIGPARLAIRINGVATRSGLADLLALAGAPTRPALILVPMVETAAELGIVRGVLADDTVGLVPLIETVKGLDNAAEIAADPGVAMVMFGGGDFSAQLGVELAWEPLLLARQRLVMACAAADKPVMDVPFIRLDDEEGLAEETRKARALGFAAKAAIHPAQIETIHSIFRPSAAEITEAEEAEAAFAAAGGAAVRFKGRMLEAPIMRRYRQVLALKGKLDA